MVIIPLIILSKDGNYVIIKKRFNLVRFSKEKLVLEEANLEKGILFSVLDFSVHISDKKIQWIRLCCTKI